jgi:TetR/AcrR family transcriptional repressor of nem operon
MARPIEFEREAALEAAMKLFWCQGYSATSLNQLLLSMNISRSSFYAAFGDKRSVFVEALELFSLRTFKIIEQAAQRDPSTAVAVFFESTLFDLPRHRVPRGCMMVNTVLEMADVDVGLSELAAAKLAEIEAVFAASFAQAKISVGGRSSAEMAEFVMLVNQGLRVASRTQASPQVLRRQVNTALSMLGLVPLAKAS